MTSEPAARKDWRKLTEYEHGRLRNEMYFGSRDPHRQNVLSYGPEGATCVEETWVPAVFTAFREILDNALDECVTHGHGNTIKVTYDPCSMIITVSDNGRGVPIDFDPEEGQYAATVLLSNLRAGRNFEVRGQARGMNGIGASMVNLCSEFFTLDIHRDGKNFNQRFRESDSEHIVEDPIIIPSGEKETGTQIEFKLSSKVFKNLILPEEFVRARVFEVALSYPRIKVFFNGVRVQTSGTVEKSLFPQHKTVSFNVKETGFVSEFWLVPGFVADGGEMAYGLVNAIPTFNGGTHIDAFKRHFFSGLIEALSSISKKKRLQPNRADIADGLLCFNLTDMDEASFDSQNKTRLINETCATSVKKALDDPEFFKRVIRANPEWIESIYTRCADRTQKKDNAEASKLAKKTLRSKVEKLQDATGRDRSKCVLFLGEGDSAISGITDARNAEIHGGLPLRGKVLNVHGKSIKKILENEALCQIMGSIGLVPGQKANRALLRYGSVYITTDADEDGKNIAALLVNFFYTLWPELFMDPARPFLYVFDTPLIIAVRGKTRKYWYNENYEAFDPAAYKGWDVTRAKGLAALKREDWKYVLANPKVQPIVDDGDLKEVLSLLFDESRADARKEFIGM